MIGMLSGTCLLSGKGEAIIDVNGVGYLLSCGSRTLSGASLEDKASFARASGVGPKLAARITMELSGKPAPSGRFFTAAFTAPSDSVEPEAARAEGLKDMMLRNDAISALQNLGIQQSDALRSVAAAYNTFAEDPPLDDLIKAALKELSA